MARAQHRIAEHRQPDQGRRGFHLGAHEEGDPENGSQQQSHVERAETAAPNRHGERIGGERQSQQQRSRNIEAGPIRLRLQAIGGQGATGEKKRQDAQRQVDEEDCPPAETGNQDAAERRTESGADRRHRSEQPHGAARFRLRNRLADKGHGERHHDGRAETLRRPGGDQQPERWCEAA
jgi:hypothetical protein